MISVFASVATRHNTYLTNVLPQSLHHRLGCLCGPSLPLQTPSEILDLNFQLGWEDPVSEALVGKR